MTEQLPPSLLPLLTQSPSTPDPRIEELFLAGLHFGYSKTRRHPRMKPYLAGLKNNVEVFNLEKTLVKLKAAETLLEELGQKNGMMLWVGAKPQAAPAIKAAAAALNHPFVHQRWLGGTLTNFTAIRKRVQQGMDLKREREEGRLEKYTKQERVKINKALERFDHVFSGLELLSRLPEALIIIDPKEESTALREAVQLGILTVALLNSDTDPFSVTHPIPGNDNAPTSIRIVIEALRNAYEKGKKIIYRTMTNQNQQNQIKQLRDETGAGFSHIRAAIAEAGGDIKSAKEILQRKGLEIATKKESRAANAGIVEAYVHHGATIGVLVELRCETDFVARNPSFKELAHNIAMHIAATNPDDVSSLANELFIKDESKTVGELVVARTASFGERIEIGRFIRYAL